MMLENIIFLETTSWFVRIIQRQRLICCLSELTLSCVVTFGGASEETYIYQELDLVFLEIATYLCRQKDTSSSTEFTILLV